MFDIQPERIVCAAIQKGETTVLGVRHFDKLMVQHLEGAGLERSKEWVQGFVTNKMRFVSREEAWIIACEQNQLCWGKDRIGDPKFQDHGLFSEDLY
jgi:hypothetical protein